MNLIAYETKSSIKSSVIWTVSLLGTFLFLMLGAYPVYLGAKNDILSLLSNYPPEFTAAFGMNIEKLMSYGGFYSFTFTYIAVIGAIMAVALSLSIFAREKRSKCSDFLLTKPLSRESIFLQKFISCFSLITITNLIYLLCAVIAYQTGTEKPVSLGIFVLAMLGLYFTQLVFLAIGILYATVAKKVRSVAGIATAFGLGAFILSAMINILDKPYLEFLAPLKYFDPTNVFETGSYNLALVGFAVGLLIICIAIAFVKFCKSDAHAL